MLPEPGALHLTRRQDLLDLELPEPNLWLYETQENSPSCSPTEPNVPPTPAGRPEADAKPASRENHEPQEDFRSESG